jgi:hypothetical protein
MELVSWTRIVQVFIQHLTVMLLETRELPVERVQPRTNYVASAGLIQLTRAQPA